MTEEKCFFSCFDQIHKNKILVCTVQYSNNKGLYCAKYNLESPHKIQAAADATEYVCLFCIYTLYSISGAETRHIPMPIFRLFLGQWGLVAQVGTQAGGGDCNASY